MCPTLITNRANGMTHFLLSCHYYRKAAYHQHIEDNINKGITREQELCTRYEWTNDYSEVTEPAMIDKEHVNDKELLHFEPAREWGWR